MFNSHFRAGTGAVLVETREESRLVREVIAEFTGKEIATIAAPSGIVKDATKGRKLEQDTGMATAYKWVSAAPGRVLIVFDWHTLANSPGHWRMLSDALPAIRNPANGDSASLVIFAGPQWELSPANPLRGLLPILSLENPNRAALATIANSLHPCNGEENAIVDALCGLSTDCAEQVCAEVLARLGKWDTDALRAARRQALKDSGLEIWPTVAELGGLSGLRTFAESELIPWLRDDQLSVRRILAAGVPGVGKSYCARWLAHTINCECARLSIPALKGGIVGQSEGNLRRALKTIDALAAHSPLVVVIDEIDTIAREGLDGGTSSGMFSELLTWLQESKSQALVIATLNHLSKLDAALESRFQARFFFDLPSAQERKAVALIHYTNLRCENPEQSAKSTADFTDGFSSREIAEHIAPSVARLSNRKPTAEIISRVCCTYSPASKTQSEQLEAMRRAASSLRRANDKDDSPIPSGRKIQNN